MLRIVSDVHGKFEKYKEIIKDVEYSLQIGDMGFNYDPLLFLDHTKNKFFGGNHDNYAKIGSDPHNLGDFGYKNFSNEEFFFVRGAFSIDQKYRAENFDWFSEEQLDTYKQDACLIEYKMAKPDVMISHGCPREIAKLIGNPDILRNFGFDPETFNTETQQLLQDCLDIHAPKLWIFGHFHINIDFIHKGTRFICKPELGFTDIKNGEVL